MFYIQYMSHLGGHISKSYPSGEVCVCVCVCVCLFRNADMEYGIEARTLAAIRYVILAGLLEKASFPVLKVSRDMCMCVCVYLCVLAGRLRDRCGFRRVWVLAPPTSQELPDVSLSDGSVPWELPRLFPKSLSLSRSGQSYANMKTHGGALCELWTQNKSHNKRDYQYSGSRAESDYRLVNVLGKMIPSSSIQCLSLTE